MKAKAGCTRLYMKYTSLDKIIIAMPMVLLDRSSNLMWVYSSHACTFPFDIIVNYEVYNYISREYGTFTIKTNVFLGYLSCKLEP